MIKIIISVSATEQYTFIEEDSLIEGLSLTRQMDADIKELSSEIECGEVNIHLSNLYNEFNVLSDTAVYNKIKVGQKIEVINLIEDKEYLFFTGKIVDFSAPTSTDTQAVDIRAVDMLHFILNDETTVKEEIQVERNQNLFDFLTTLFAPYHIEPDQLDIDPQFKQIFLNYSILSGHTFSDQLNAICQAVDGYVYVDRLGKIIVRMKEFKGSPIKEFSREDNENYLVGSEYGLSLFSSYKELKVGYVSTKQSAVQNLLSIDNLSLQPSFNNLNNLKLSVSNLYELDSIKLTSSSNSTVEEVAATSSTVSLIVNNPSQTEDIAKLDVYGKVIETADAYIVKEVGAEQADQSLEVKSILVQDKGYAESLATKLYERAIEPIPYILVDVEVSTLDLDLGTVVKVKDTEAEFEYVGYVHSIDAEYDGNGYYILKLGIKALSKDKGVKP